MAKPALTQPLRVLIRVENSSMPQPPSYLSLLIRRCRKQDRQAQEELYRHFYAYALNICLHYAQDTEEAKDILNEGFFRVFDRLHQYDLNRSFKGWLRRLLINVAIDYHRRYHGRQALLEIMPTNEPRVAADSFSQLAMDDLLAMVQRLSPMYRLVFNLYIMEGLTHPEIATRLGISVGASKSNLSRAKQKLREMLAREAARTDHYKEGL